MIKLFVFCPQPMPFSMSSLILGSKYFNCAPSKSVMISLTVRENVNFRRIWKLLFEKSSLQLRIGLTLFGIGIHNFLFVRFDDAFIFSKLVYHRWCLQGADFTVAEQFYFHKNHFVHRPIRLEDQYTLSFIPISRFAFFKNEPDLPINNFFDIQAHGMAMLSFIIVVAQTFCPGLNLTIIPYKFHQSFNTFRRCCVIFRYRYIWASLGSQIQIIFMDFANDLPSVVDVYL